MPKLLSQHPKVRGDIVEIHSFIARDNPEAADGVVDAIKLVFQKLTAFPELGPVYHGAGISHLRMMPVPGCRNYLVFYRVLSAEVRVLYVLHGARNLARLLREESRQ